jgi:hypothetical protein
MCVETGPVRRQREGCEARLSPRGSRLATLRDDLLVVGNIARDIVDAGGSTDSPGAR